MEQQRKKNISNHTRLKKQLCVVEELWLLSKKSDMKFCKVTVATAKL
jgi:hypothetical protein